MDQDIDQPASSNATQKQIRITSQGKMKSWIAFALAFLEESEDDKTITLHTLPYSLSGQADLDNSDNSQSIPHKTASAVTSTVPRLISVSEIIKREYIKNLEKSHSSRPFGLHQYNEIGTLEELGIIVNPTIADEEATGPESREHARAQQIAYALGGHNHPRQIQTPFMRITLSTMELPELVARGAHYQPPILRKFSKSAKARAKKRAKAKAKQSVAEPMVSSSHS